MINEAIAREAYIIYQDRCRRGLPGSDVEDWVEAEKRVYGRIKEQIINYKFHYPYLAEDRIQEIE